VQTTPGELAAAPARPQEGRPGWPQEDSCA
jgi:hypothetical protein